MLASASSFFNIYKPLGKKTCNAVARVALACITFSPFSNAMSAAAPVERLSSVSSESVCIAASGTETAPISRDFTLSDFTPFDGTAMGGNFFAKQSSWIQENLISVDTIAGGSMGCTVNGRGEATSRFSLNFELTEATGYSLNGKIIDTATGENPSSSSIVLYAGDANNSFYTLQSNDIQPSQQNNQQGILQAGEYTLDIISEINDYAKATTSAEAILSFSSVPVPVPVPPAILLMMSALLSIGWLQRKNKI